MKMGAVFDWRFWRLPRREKYTGFRAVWVHLLCWAIFITWKTEG